MTAAILSLLTLVSIDASFELRDVNQQWLKPFAVKEKAAILFFLSTECPISRFYAAEIQRICKTYASDSAECRLVYEDAPIDDAAVREHLREFGYQGVPAVVDRSGEIARRSGASVTPEAIVLDKAASVRYRGRIDNFYADLGKPRRQATVHDLTDAIDAVLAGVKVLHPETEPVGCFIVPPEPQNGKERK